MRSVLNRRSALVVAGAGVLISTSGFAEVKMEKVMSNSVEKACKAYLYAWQNKDIDGVSACVHPDIQFKSPNAATTGRDAYLKAAARFFPLFDRIEIREEFYSGNGAMIALDFNCMQPIGLCPTAELIGFRDGLIFRDQLFFDARPFEALMRARAANPGGK